MFTNKRLKKINESKIKNSHLCDLERLRLEHVFTRKLQMNFIRNDPPLSVWKLINIKL